MSHEIPELPQLPLSQYRAQFEQALATGLLLLEAEPGAGKSTLAPLWALAQAPEDQRVWLVQPRVLAAQSLARRLAELLGERCGQRVGYQVPYDARMSEVTRLLVMTPGILLQMLLHNPSLEGVAVVMLDEIHERSVNQDLAWAWLQEAQILRDDLRLVLMSATPDPALQRQISRRFFAEGRCFPVATRYQPPRQSPGQKPESLTDQLLRALASQPDWQERTVLVFLPGWRAIEDAAWVLQQAFPSRPIYRLHSQVPAAEQQLALDPAQGPRLILSTNIAETSLTIADVTLVIDSGLVRRADFEQRTGLTRLRESRISQASADQRRGRAGRVQAGVCVRLWSQDQPLAAAELPEIRSCDYLPLALRLAHWGTQANQLNWLEAPGPLALAQAQRQLSLWGLLDDEGRITRAGLQVSDLGCHPRLAVLLQQQLRLTGQLGREALNLALALHFELPPAQGWSEWLMAAEQTRHPHWGVQRQRWLEVLGQSSVGDAPLHPQALALAFNDRIGFRQESGRYRLNSGISIESSERLESPCAVFPLVQPRAKGHDGLGLALELDAQAQKRLSQLESQLVYRQNSWQQHLCWRMGGVTIAEEYQPVPAEQLAPALGALLGEIIRERGLDALGWNEEARSLLARARLLLERELIQAPALDDQALADNLSRWLLPFVDAQTRLDALPLLEALSQYLGYACCQQIDSLLPTHIKLPSGRRVSLSFSAEGVPEISAKLQEFFGCDQLQLAGGRVPLRIHLLSPNGSPLAITTDLASFWRQGYAGVRKEMRGRYPRHPWPEDPWSHQPTALTNRRLQAQQDKT